MKNLIYSVILTAAFLSFNSSKSESFTPISETVIPAEYTYEIVYIDGVRWVFVYDEDGKLVNFYEDEE